MLKPMDIRKSRLWTFRTDKTRGIISKRILSAGADLILIFILITAVNYPVLAEKITKTEAAREFYLKGLKQLEAKNYAFALEEIGRAVNLDPSNPLYITVAGDVYFEMEQYSKAMEMYRKGSKLNTSWSIPYLKMGLCYIKLEDKSSALIFLKKAEELGSIEAKEFIELVTQKYRETADAWVDEKHKKSREDLKEKIKTVEKEQKDSGSAAVELDTDEEESSSLLYWIAGAGAAGGVTALLLTNDNSPVDMSGSWEGTINCAEYSKPDTMDKRIIESLEVNIYQKDGSITAYYVIGWYEKRITGYGSVDKNGNFTIEGNWSSEWHSFVDSGNVKDDRWKSTLNMSGVYKYKMICEIWMTKH